MLPPFFSNKSHWIQLCYLLLFIVGGLTLFTSLALLAGKMSAMPLNSREYLHIIQFISSLGTFLVPALLFAYCASNNCFSYNEADKIAPPHMVAYVLVLSIFILPIIACLGYFNEQISFPESMRTIAMWMQEMEEQSKGLMQTLTANSNIPILLMNLVFMALLPAIFEEFLFRGTIQQFFTKWFANKHVAIIVSAFIFSVIHLQFYGFIPRFLLGIYLGYLFVWGGSLWLPIIAHLMHNANSIILDHNAQRRGIDVVNIDPTQIAEFYPAVIFCSICVGVGIYLLWKKGKRNFFQRKYI